MRETNPIRRRRTHGQTLVAALFVLGVLLILGLVFVGIISQNVRQSATARQRSAASDLAEAGVRYAHSQLVYSVQGADWRPTPTLPLSARDPDYDYLRPDPDGNPANGDQGGPDQLGAYSRINQGNGRFLVRVRFAPSDAVLFSTAQQGPLRQPGKARNYLILESVGRIGRVVANDPTTLLGSERQETRKLIAFASIGIIESAVFITNKDRVSRPAELGVPEPLGVRYEGADVEVPLQLGSSTPMFNFGNPPTPTAGSVLFGGSLYSNTGIVLHGSVNVNLNVPLGDAWHVNGSLRGAAASSRLNVNRTDWNPTLGLWQVSPYSVGNATTPSLNSLNPSFSTLGGVLRDEVQAIDVDGYWRSVGYKAPPSLEIADPETGLNRFESLTRNSGVVGPGGNAGRYGHGRGVYVDNTQDRQMREDEEGRERVGSSESLVYDWFNPNNGQAGTGWIGPYYVPRGATLILNSDGFSIIRDPRATGRERTWRAPDGSDTGIGFIRYRLGLVNGQVFVINTFTPGVNINSANPNFSFGMPFNGVLLFEGNVRVRGTIPTDAQLTVVSNATIYVEGSVTKGVLRNHITDATGLPPAPTRINRPSRSMLMLAARDYVAVNTTMFSGPSPLQALDEVDESGNPIAWNPLRIQSGGGTFTFRNDLVWDPDSGLGPALPDSWETFAQGYAEFNAPGSPLNSRLLLTHATDDGPAPYTFLSLDVNYGLPSFNYLFEMVPPNSAAPFFAPQPYGPIYGLGAELWQRYPKFESNAFPLLDPTALVPESNGLLLRANAAGTYGDYRVIAGGLSDYTIRMNQVGFGATNDYLLARTAVLPGDVRIEASLFAENGSVVVIPGNWVNPNPNDSRETFEARVTVLQGAPYNLPLDQAILTAQAERRDSNGSGPDMPFYGEPLDIRIVIHGAVSQNMPLPISYQAEWLRKWGWIPRNFSANYHVPGSGTQVLIPERHVPAGYDITGADRYVPNLIVTYDATLATASLAGFGSDYLRRDRFGRSLPPMPALPVGPKLAYFGEVLR